MRTVQEPGGTPLEESEVARQIRSARESGAIQRVLDRTRDVTRGMDEWAYRQGREFYYDYLAALESGAEGAASSGPAAAAPAPVGVDLPDEERDREWDAGERIVAGSGEPVTASNAPDVAGNDAVLERFVAFGSVAAKHGDSQKGGKRGSKGHPRAAQGSAQARGDRYNVPGHMPGWQVKGKGRSRSSKGSSHGSGPPQPSAPPGAPPQIGATSDTPAPDSRTLPIPNLNPPPPPPPSREGTAGTATDRSRSRRDQQDQGSRPSGGSSASTGAKGRGRGQGADRRTGHSQGRGGRGRGGK